MAFVIDTTGEPNNLQDTDQPQGNESVFSRLEDNGEESETRRRKRDPLQGFLDHFIGNKRNKNSKDTRKNVVAEAMKKSVITPEFEQLHSIPPMENTGRKFKKQQKVLAARTKGKQWFGLPAPELTEEIKHDLELIQMRSALDPKRFYKKNDLKVLPKYFQIGKVMDSPLDYNNRLTNKERKSTIVDELLNDAEFDKYNKRKYKEIITEKQKTHFKSWRQAKRLKRKKK